MRKLLLMFTLCLSLSALAQKPFVIPELQTWQAAMGNLPIGQKLTIGVTDPALKQAATQFAADLKTMFGIKAFVVEKAQATIVMACAPLTDTNPEAYMMNITVDGVTVKANQPIGAFWATRTLLQMLEQNRALPCGHIEDAPAYPVRGFMLDVGRKFFSIDYLRAVTRLMSYYKMNAFQIHLNDNAFPDFYGGDWDKTPSGFRLECETYPGLTSKDHYTKQEFHDLQIMARDLGVTIIPELDAPAHALAFYHYDKKLCGERFGRDHLDLLNPDVVPFMDKLWDEYLRGNDPVFVGDIVHIGTDEYSNADKAVVEKFREYTDHYISLVEGYGKKAGLWGSLTHAKGQTPIKVKDVLMWMWSNGYADPKEMMDLGYDMVSIPDGYTYIVPQAGYYYDYLNHQFLYEQWTPANIGGTKFEEGHPQIKGGMFAVWNDHPDNGISYQDVYDRIFPAVQTLAAKFWDADKVTVKWAEFDAKRQQLSEAPGLNLLGRTKGGQKGLIYQAQKPQSGKAPLADIGYNYRVTFDVTAKAAKPGTILFASDNATFYLADPKTGKLGFSRDGADYTFQTTVPLGQKVTLAIEGTNMATTLYVNGAKAETLEIVDGRPSKKGAKPNRWVQTLIFPLAKVCPANKALGVKFSGKLENLKVEKL